MLKVLLSARRAGSLLNPAGRGLPGSNSLFFASPKKSKQKKGDPGSCVPFAALRGNLRCSVQPGSKTTRFAQTSFCPDPSGPALLGASTRGWGQEYQTAKDRKPHTENHKDTPWRVLVGIWFPLPIAPSWLGRGAQRQADQGWRCLSEAQRSEFSQTPLGSSTAGCPKRSGGTQTAGRLFFGDFLLAKQKKVTGRRATPGQLPLAEDAPPEQDPAGGQQVHTC
ncbi:hypothetical protein SAMN05720382_1047 [Polaromonas sp. JS666]|nr:hypothetical protein SAMN05720382_1047 [Polaromonas sp. JS666]